MRNKWFIISITASLALFVVWSLLFSGDLEARMWYAFLVNFLFFTSLAGGLAVWPAIVVSAYGKWMGSAERLCRIGIAFSVPSLVALVVLWVSSGHWAPWVHHDKGLFWLNNNFLFIRNLVALSLFWFMAFLFIYKRYTSKKRIYARWFVLSYVVAFSLLGFDFVMALEPEWYSMMMGGYFFITGVYVAAAAWALLAILSGQTGKSTLHDIGKLMIAFCMFSAYLLFSQLFPIWYENNPHETVFLIPRMNYSWKWVGYLLLLLVYLGPIAFLLPAGMKRNPLPLGIVAALIVIGMWIERWWLVYAVFEWDNIWFGLPELISLLAFTALFLAGGILVKIFKLPEVEPEKPSS